MVGLTCLEAQRLQVDVIPLSALFRLSGEHGTTKPRVVGVHHQWRSGERSDGGGGICGFLYGGGRSTRSQNTNSSQAVARVCSLA